MYMYMYVPVYSSCSAESGQHEACMCECCPGCALQLFCWKLKHMYELYAVIQNWLLARYEQHFIHVCCLGTSNKYTYMLQ